MGNKSNAALSPSPVSLWNKLPRRALGVVLATGLACAASAQFNYKVTVTNNTGLMQNDIHLLFINTGGTITNRVVANPGGLVLPSQGNEFNASFNATNNGQTFVGYFSAGFGNVMFNSGNWTWNGVPNGAINAGDVNLQATPEPAPMVAMGVGVVGLLARRRRKLA